MNKHINYKDVNFYKPLISDFLENSQKITPLIANNFTNIKEAIANRRFPLQNRKILVKSIKQQYSNANLNAPKEVELLLDKNTFTVTTGHQLNIFGGPLYFIFKIIETIKLAKTISDKNPNNKVIPIFWMATEDHDFQEINSVSILNQTLIWQTNQTGAVGRFIIDDNFIELINEIQSLTNEKPNSDELFNILSSSYVLGETLTNATRRFVSKLFQSTKLVIVDGDDSELKKLAHTIFEKELDYSIAYKAVSQTNTYLEQNGYHQQVFARDINLFWLGENSRERIEKVENSYETVNSKKKLSKNELISNIQNVSPNAILRPVYQETILPNIVYTGGAGEIAYWLQIKNVFSEFDIDFPILNVRNSLLMLDKTTQSRIEKLELPFENYFHSIDDLKSTFVKNNLKDEVSLKSYIDKQNALFSELETYVETIEKNLSNKVQALKAQTEKSINDIEKKLIKSQKDQFETSLNQIQKIKEKLFPNGILQERIESSLFYFAIYGYTLFEQIEQTIIPFNNDIKVLANE